jgi:hypothetical protein
MADVEIQISEVQMSQCWEGQPKPTYRVIPIRKISREELQRIRIEDEEKTSQLWRLILWYFLACVMLGSAYGFYLMVR